MDKKELKKIFKSMNRRERQELILKKMKAKGIEPGSGVPNKTYNNDDVLDLIKIANCFPELRKNKWLKNNFNYVYKQIRNNYLNI